MEYYKMKYEEAMLRMNKWVEGSEIIEPKEVAEFVFPELKESEDLKIKKDIQYAVRCAYGDNSNNTNSILAWLEKQGNNINCIYDKELSELLHIVICRYVNDPDISYIERENVSKKIFPYVELLEKQGEQSNKVSIWKHWNNGIAGNGEGKLVYLIKNGSTYSLSSCLGFECNYIELSDLDKLYVEKQDEQKPADKCEGCNNVKGCITCTNGDQYAHITEQKPAAYFYCKYGGTIPKCSDCVRNHLNSKYKTEEIKTWMTPASRGTKQCSDYIPQDSVKWGEEDEKMWSTISDLLWEGFKLSDGKVSWDKIRCWLLPFKDRVQTHPKQEWSEEDEEMFDAIIADIQFTQKAHTHDVNQIVYEREIDWLKSLKERMKGE